MSTPQRVIEGYQSLLSNAEALEFLRSKYGWSNEIIVDMYLGLEEGRFLFPSKDLDGVWHYTTRQWKDDGPKYKHSGPPWPDFYYPRPLDGKPVWLCEGHADTVTAQMLGLNAMGLVGTSTVSRALERLKSYKTVVLVMDADAPGWKASRALVTGLLETDTDVRVVLLSDPLDLMKHGLAIARSNPTDYVNLGRDLTDFYKEFGHETTQERLLHPSISGPSLMALKNPKPTPRPWKVGASQDIGKILDALQCGKACPCSFAARRGWGAVHCPSHADPTPSFSVKDENGRVLVHCFAGCDQNAVIKALVERGLWRKSESSPVALGARSRASGYRSDSRFRWSSLPTSRVPEGRRLS